jgi:hypothetical protein
MMKINQLLMNLHRSDGFFNHAMHGLQTNTLTPECSPLRGLNSCGRTSFNYCGACGLMLQKRNLLIALSNLPLILSRMSLTLEEFREYVANSGVNFVGLSNDGKRQWRESFDRSRQHPAGKLTFKILFHISNQVLCIIYIICDFLRRFYRVEPIFL